MFWMSALPNITKSSMNNIWDMDDAFAFNLNPLKVSSLSFSRIICVRASVHNTKMQGRVGLLA
ncbi:hypothetical protein Scep_027755 [Stephania cephalantha]|uniref:Uncharacterized protein n=1 Tax=Stephania cephalantha TaxID=152367 RepID=A0AAP0EG09_9MAGN